uniref:Recep_L_domain domain-containing protein n=1 Tax=Steinernema glaseri TaxID=37863 RepID=A0A1I7ZEU0_9BILA
MIVSVLFVSSLVLCTQLLTAQNVTCEDGKDNLISLGECQPFGLLKAFNARSLRFFSYDRNMKPMCHTSFGVKRPALQFPGFLKIDNRSTLTMLDALEPENTFIHLTMTRTYPYLQWLCLGGFGMSMFSNFCRFNICAIIGTDYCNFISRPGVYNSSNIPDRFNHTIRLPPLQVDSFLASLFEGNYRIEAHFVASLEERACVSLPADGSLHITTAVGSPF